MTFDFNVYMYAEKALHEGSVAYAMGKITCKQLGELAVAYAEACGFKEQ